MQANYGERALLRVDGVPVGRDRPDVVPSQRAAPAPEAGSIIVVLATDAPLLPIQCQRLARRATVGLAGSAAWAATAAATFSSRSRPATMCRLGEPVSDVRMLAPEAMTTLFQAAAEATEEAILNALCAAETMTGLRGRTVHALPHERLIEAMRRRG